MSEIIIDFKFYLIIKFFILLLNQFYDRWYDTAFEDKTMCFNVPKFAGLTDQIFHFVKKQISTYDSKDYLLQIKAFNLLP